MEEQQFIDLLRVFSLTTILAMGFSYFIGWKLAARTALAVAMVCTTISVYLTQGHLWAVAVPLALLSLPLLLAPPIYLVEKALQKKHKAKDVNLKFSLLVVYSAL